MDPLDFSAFNNLTPQQQGTATNDLFGGVGDFLSAVSDFNAADSTGKALQYAKMNQAIDTQKAYANTFLAGEKGERVLGQDVAFQAAQGFKNNFTVLHSTAMNAQIYKSQVATQGYEQLNQDQAQIEGLAAQKQAQEMGGIMGIVGGIGKLASMFMI
jgi:hypothetical protein